MSSCNYSCSDKDPAWSSNSDITGKGVIINYVATSGIALLIIIVYYFTTYQPTRDPFKIDHVLSPSRPQYTFRPNAVDVLVLRFVRRISKKLFGARTEVFWPNARLEPFFIKSILAMGDLQIVTGTSILVSGFAQFQCGLATYYWLVIVYLAWFSSLTHLSCLTLLRHYLYSRPSERGWRLFAMGLLAVLLAVGLTFTGTYSWAFNEGRDNEGFPNINDYAACYLHVFPSTSIAFISMIVSVFLIVIGFTSRAVKLHRTLSVDIFGRARDFLSSHARCRLRIMFNWCSIGSPQSLKRTICYYPLLAAFLELRFLLDCWASMLLEVSWLLVAFTWGIIRLIEALLLPGSQGLEDSSGGNSSNWGFGQVVALVLLVAPLITLVEYFSDASGQDIKHDTRNGSGSEETERSSPQAQLTNNLGARASTIMAGDFGDLDNPDNDWQHQIRTHGPSTVFVVILCISQCIFLFPISTRATALGGVAQIFRDSYYVTPFSALFLVIMNSLLIQNVMPQERNRLRTGLEAANIVFAYVPFIPSLPFLPLYYLQPFSLMIYIGACLWYRFLS